MSQSLWTLRSVQQHHRCLRNPVLFKPGCGVFVFGQCSPFHRSQLCFVCPCATSSAPSKRAASLQTSRTQRLALFLGCERPHRAVQDTTLFAQPCCCPSRSASPRGAAPCRDLALSVDLIRERSEENFGKEVELFGALMVVFSPVWSWGEIVPDSFTWCQHGVLWLRGKDQSLL